MKIYQILLSVGFILLNFNINAQDKLNIELHSSYKTDEERYSGSWYYIDELGNEYGLVGGKDGTSIVELVGIDETEGKAFIPGPSSNWREITVLGDYAYVTTEGGADTVGMHVIDLSPLPTGTPYLLTEYKTTFQKGHIIQRDIYSEDPYVYVIGTSATQGVHILDVSNPAAPLEVGLYQPGYYIHDAHINGDLMFCAAFSEAQFDVVDISDKTNPVLINTIEDPGTNTHSSWLTEDKKYLFSADESDGFVGRIFNVEDLEDVFEVAQYTANIESLVHNPYIRGDYAYISHNTEGLRIVDIADPTCPVEVGYYDTFEGPSGGFSGLWSACPFMPSGKILGGDRTEGLLVWEFNNTKAARIYGEVVDANTQLPIENVVVTILELNETLTTDANGKYKIGFYPNVVTINFSAENYVSKMLTIDLVDGGHLNEVTELATTVNIDELTLQGDFMQISPNPASDFLYVEFANDETPEYLLIVDAQGKVLRKLKNEEQSLLKINVDELSVGVYYLQLPDGRGLSFVKK